ncbi:MAG TPA: spore maturation protein [Tissierellia bacterium]|jgi:spore maturation protein A|nr:spore maturation protein [Tissierellia bacterium]
MKTMWCVLVLSGIFFSFLKGEPQTVTNVLFLDLQKSVELIVSLLPIMAFWTGLMKVVEKTNILNKISYALKPLVKFLFRDIIGDVKAVNAIVLTLSANMLGLGNSATAFGIQAMKELQRNNKNKKIATNAMCMFLIINVSSIQLIPINVIKLRADSGSIAPSEIILPTLVATSFSTLIAIFFTKYYERKKI